MFPYLLPAKTNYSKSVIVCLAYYLILLSVAALFVSTTGVYKVRNIGSIGIEEPALSKHLNSWEDFDPLAKLKALVLCPTSPDTFVEETEQTFPSVASKQLSVHHANHRGFIMQRELGEWRVGMKQSAWVSSG